MRLDHRFRVDHDKRLFPPDQNLRAMTRTAYRIPQALALRASVSVPRVAGEEQVFKKQHASGEKHAKDRAKQESEGVCHATLLRHLRVNAMLYPVEIKGGQILAMTGRSAQEAHPRRLITGSW